MTAKFVQPNYTAQDSATYKANIDTDISVLAIVAAMFAPHAQDSPNMTARIDAGSILANGAVVSQSAQNTGTITAPVSNPRYDLIVIDALTAAISVVTGTEAVSPSLPAIPNNKIPIAQISLSVGQSSIINANITDLRTSFGKLTSVAPVVVKTAGYNMAVSDINQKFQANVATANSWNLPSASAVPSGAEITIENIGAGAVTILTAIEGISNIPIVTGWTICIYSDGSIWRIKSFSTATPMQLIPGNYFILASATTQQSMTGATPTKKKEFKATMPGNVTVQWDLESPSGSGLPNAQVYINGSPVGSSQSYGSLNIWITMTQIVSVNIGDLVQIYIWNGTASPAGTTNIKNAYLMSGGYVNIPAVAVVNLN
jgi:hypothetical protein